MRKHRRHHDGRRHHGDVANYGAQLSILKIKQESIAASRGHLVRDAACCVRLVDNDPTFDRE